VAIHLTPSELADEMNMKRREVISKCMEMGVPIFNGRIDKTLFLSNLRQFGQVPKTPQAAA
jgi:Translation initiation factor IF-2, N-terminal region